jgi:hypothetical protein
MAKKPNPFAKKGAAPVKGAKPNPFAVAKAGKKPAFSKGGKVKGKC